jgi:hypothetical protein
LEEFVAVGVGKMKASSWDSEVAPAAEDVDDSKGVICVPLACELDCLASASVEGSDCGEEKR